MITFFKGPANGIVLDLRRAPLFLRVVQKITKEFDALDQLDDEPTFSERLFAYRRVGKAGRVHIQHTYKGKRTCGWYAMAEYRFVDPQPGDDVMRSKEKWQAWAKAQAKGNTDGR